MELVNANSLAAVLQIDKFPSISFSHDYCTKYPVIYDRKSQINELEIFWVFQKPFLELLKTSLYYNIKF